jgi:hypothetical protein
LLLFNSLLLFLNRRSILDNNTCRYNFYYVGANKIYPDAVLDAFISNLRADQISTVGLAAEKIYQAGTPENYGSIGGYWGDLVLHYNTIGLSNMLANNYYELAKLQAIDENLESYSCAIKHYLTAYAISKVQEKEDTMILHSIANCFYQIADICDEVSTNADKYKAVADKYKTVANDATYMSTSYYLLFRLNDSANFNNNYYLARKYKRLATQFNDKYKIYYYNQAKTILSRFSLPKTVIVKFCTENHYLLTITP